MSDISDAAPRLKAMNDALEEIDRLRLTEAEREAIDAFAFDRPMDRTAAQYNAATLRRLLERLA